MSSQHRWWAKVLRILGIVLMSLTAAFTILGGAGTSCVALDPTGYEGKFAGIAPFQWLYILFVIVTLVIGGMGVRAAVLLVQGKRNAYRRFADRAGRRARASASFTSPPHASCAEARCRWTWWFTPRS